MLEKLHRGSPRLLKLKREALEEARKLAIATWGPEPANQMMVSSLPPPPVEEVSAVSLASEASESESLDFDELLAGVDSSPPLVSTVTAAGPTNGIALVSDDWADDILAQPEVATPPEPSKLQIALQTVRDRALSPFYPNGKPRLMVRKLPGFSNIGFFISSRFTREGDDHEYNISGKVMGEKSVIPRSGDNILVHEDGRAVSANKNFGEDGDVLWEGRKVTGALWVWAVHLKPGREFHVWLNDGSTTNGDREKIRFKVLPNGEMETTYIIGKP
jgi:hypothetical protein